MANTLIQYIENVITQPVAGSSSFNAAATTAGRQGSELGTVTITPLLSNSIMIIRFMTPYAGETTNHSNGADYAIYKNNETVSLQTCHYQRRYTNSIPWGSTVMGTANHSFPIDFITYDAPGSTSAVTYRIWGGCGDGAIEINRIGGTTPSSSLGSYHSILSVSEYAP